MILLNMQQTKIFCLFLHSIFKILIKELKEKLNLKKGILIHGGGWKKLDDIKISNEKFKYLLNKKFELKELLIIMELSNKQDQFS